MFFIFRTLKFVSKCLQDTIKTTRFLFSVNALIFTSSSVLDGIVKYCKQYVLLSRLLTLKEGLG
jgi:hypothetical protein